MIAVFWYEAKPVSLWEAYFEHTYQARHFWRVRHRDVYSWSPNGFRQEMGTELLNSLEMASVLCLATSQIADVQCSLLGKNMGTYKVKLGFGGFQSQIEAPKICLCSSLDTHPEKHWSNSPKLTQEDWQSRKLNSRFPSAGLVAWSLDHPSSMWEHY